jgi:hypothetical protein
MTDRQPRAREQRRADTLAKLSASAVDVWVATAAADPDWREVDELPGRTLMRDGAWIT